MERCFEFLAPLKIPRSVFAVNHGLCPSKYLNPKDITMNRAKLFAGLRSRGSGVFGTSLSQGQVDGIEKILDEAIRRRTPLRWLSYIFATAYHETAHTMQPIRERGGEKYLRSKRYYPWVGEGLVQVTWEVNHRKFGATKPGQMLTWPIALRAIFDGMEKGTFTTKKLSDYIVGIKVDYVGARRIVNGTDRAADIGGYAKAFELALTSAGYGVASPQPAPPPPAKPVPAPVAQKPAPKPPSPALPAKRSFIQIIIDFILGRKT